MQDSQTVGDKDVEADRTVALPFANAETQRACWVERFQVCGEIHLALAEVRQRTPLAGLLGPPGDDTKAHCAWDRGRRSSSSFSSSSTAPR